MKAIDLHVGHKIKWYRAQSGLSQQELADRLNISYQQLHKYENGSNSISASRMLEVVGHLNIGVSQLFEGYGEEGDHSKNFPALSKEQSNLIKHFNQISEKEQRDSLIELIHSLAE